MSALRNEYLGPTTSRLGHYYRGGSYVFNNGSGNVAVNGSAGVPTSGPLRFNTFRGKAAGWTYTHTGTQVTAGDHIWIHLRFGVDWNGKAWPKTFINNGMMASNSTSYYPCVIYQGAGVITFINNSEMQAAGGVGAVYGSANATAGQHALVITQCTTKPKIINNSYIAGGGGGGGWGGAGGTGGQGYYVYTAQEGPYFNADYRTAYQPSYTQQTGNGGQYNVSGSCNFYWGGNISGNLGAQNVSAWASGGITYYRGAFAGSYGNGGSQYQIYRQYPANAYTGGGGGGIGGNGGRGIGYNTPNAGGTGGAAGAGGGTNAGAGGAGGTGGTGASWGGVGNTGNTGAGGGYGNYTGWGPGGAGGSGGGGAGLAIYSDCAWSLVTGGTLYGSYGGPVGPS
jgi:hypothetical protein